MSRVKAQARRQQVHRVKNLRVPFSFARTSSSLNHFSGWVFDEDFLNKMKKVRTLNPQYPTFWNKFYMKHEKIAAVSIFSGMDN